MPRSLLGVPFKIRFTTTAANNPAIQYRIGNGTWETYNGEDPPALTADASLSAFAIDGSTGARSAARQRQLHLCRSTARRTSVHRGCQLQWPQRCLERAFGITNPNADDDGDGYTAITEQNYGTDPPMPAATLTAPCPKRS